MTKVESNVINNLRFPLAFLVVLWHTPQDMVLKPLIEFDFCTIDFFQAFIILLGENLVQISVPAFFVISGYLFYVGLQNSSEKKADKNFFLTKYKKRIKSLLIPYLLWNLVVVVYFLIVKIVACVYLGRDWSTVVDFIVKTIPDAFWVADSHETYFTNLLGIVHMEFTPIVVPLWFIRDLMVMVLISPLFYWLIRKAGEIFLFIFVVLFLTNLWIEIPGFEIRAITFFYIGAFLSVRTNNLFSFSTPTISVLMLLSLFLSIFFGGREINIEFGSHHCFITGTDTKWYFSRLFILLGTAGVFYYSKIFLNKECLFPKLFVDSTFFIYALHTIVLIYIIHDFIIRIIGVGNCYCNLVAYLSTPIITTLVIISIYSFCAKYMPKTTKILSGGR